MSGFSRADCLYKIVSWAPNKTKSFSLLKIWRENYSVTTHFKNRIVFEVKYFSNKEGKYTLPGKFDYNYYYSAGATRFIFLKKRGESREGENRRIYLRQNEKSV